MLSVDALLTGGLLIIVSEQNVLRDGPVPGEDLHDRWFLYGARIQHSSTSRLSRKRRRTVPDDR